MFYNDHAPPHFHAVYGEFEIRVSIQPIRILSGNAPLSRGDVFGSVRIAPDGRYIEWPGGPDLCADALWMDAAPVHETA